MNTAYLILAHNQPNQLERLLSRLNQPGVYFYIHIDRKSKDLDALLALKTKFINATILSVNNVNWMGYYMVDSTLRLMQLAVDSQISFKYIVLMSGQDYPIRSNTYINDFYTKHNTDFIYFDNVSLMPANFGIKVNYYHYMDVEAINPRNPKRNKLLTYLYFGLHKRFRQYFPKRKFYKGMQPFFGSQWFALRLDTIKYILEYVKQNPGYVSYMKNTEGPDELFFQTIILNSERRTNVYGYNNYLEYLKTRKPTDQFSPGYSSLRYMDWGAHLKSKPAVLDLSYYDTLKTEDYLYARKVDEKTSAQLLDKIDATLLDL